MPFTLAHPIAIIPVWYASRRYLDLAALCLGAIVPDLDLFIRFIPEGGHTLRGIILLDVPWAIALLIIGRWVIARPFIALLPPYLASCLPPPKMPQVFVAVVSIIIGAISHIIWDSFTHSNGWFVTRYDFLRVTVGRWPLYELLQHGCGVAGLLSIALWIAWLLGQAKPQHRPETLSLTNRFVITMLIAIITIISTLLDIKTSVKLHQTREVVLATGVVGGITGMGVSFLIYSICFWLFRPPSKNSLG
jgi:Domain of unknown function (DUF4184)